MVHTLTEILSIGFLAVLAVFLGLIVREITKGLLDELFENPADTPKVCNSCYGLGFDLSGQRCKCKQKEKS
jgi:hypothetical protein